MNKTEPRGELVVDEPAAKDEGCDAVGKKRRCIIFFRANPMWTFLGFLMRHWRFLLSLVIMAAGGYLIHSGFNTGTCVADLSSWLRQCGDPSLLKFYDEAKDARDRKSWGVVFKAYEKRYGKGAWVQHFNREGCGEDIAYRDIAELAVGLSTAEEREAFLESHATTYEACLQDGKIDLALQYGKTLKELQKKGGESWRLASRNPFALCVYEAVKDDAELWGWYINNAAWCDAYLMTIEPELQNANSDEGTGLLEAVVSVREHSLLLRQFAKEISTLSDDELRSLADGENIEECREALFASSLMFVGPYHNVLKPMLECSSGISMLEAMAVVSNNSTAFGLDEDGALDSPSKSRNAAMSFIRIHEERKIIWDFAMDERGIDCITFCERVRNYEWCEQIIGMYGEAEAIAFLNKYYGGSDQLLRVATEILYRCQEPGWAVLQEYRGNEQVRDLILNERIGFRLVPYYLKKGYAGLSELTGDERWIDELLDKNGNLKRMDVSWYEMSPIGGDVATVVKKWAQNRPVTAAELGWAAFDVADTAAMAFSFGMSKFATTGVKTATKITVKRVGQRVARDVARRSLRKISKDTAVRMAKRSAKSAAKVGSRKVSFLRKVNKWFRKVPGVAFKGKNSALVMAKKPTLLSKTWTATKQLDRKTWQNVYKGCKTLMWCRYFGHTIPDKGPDFAYSVLESSGEFVGRTLNALVSGAGDGLKAAVREALGLTSDGDDKLLKWALGGLLFVFGLVMFLRTGKRR